jgi:alpha-galactosidase
MMKKLLVGLTVLSLASAKSAGAVSATANEMAEARRWTAAKFDGADPFFSFIYDGRPCSNFLGNWKRERGSNRLDAHRTQHTLTYTDPEAGLIVRCVGVAWESYPTVEWTLYFKNAGATDTPLIESIQALDVSFQRGAEGEFLLHHHVGDKCTLDSFAPIETVLAANTSLTFAPVGGRPSNGQWPYYNLEDPHAKEGVLIAIGWPGQWASQFRRDGGTALRIIAGQELTHFRLHPGEEIRTPLIVLQFYRGAWLRAQNVWRRWMFDHNFPKDHGRPLAPKTGAATIGFFNADSTQDGDLEFIDRSLKNGLELTTWWMDAGWYKGKDGQGWSRVGNWEVDEKRFPGGIKAIADRCHANGMELLVWFEPERVSPGSWLAQNHPEWLLAGKKVGSDQNLLNLGNPDARSWITERIDRLLTENGIDFYRQDFNMDPLAYWRGNDPPDRQGITEAHHVQGYLAYWDELRRRHPGMLIDSCASGGRRNDLETMRRAVPLLRSDFEGHPEGNQCHTYCYGLWLPYFDAVHNWQESPYVFRSAIAPFLQRNWDVRKQDFNFALAKRFLSQWRSVVDNYFGDFYPLSEHSTADNVWAAWQFDRPDLSAGVVQAFRRAQCPYVTARYKLRSLEAGAFYEVTDLDTNRPQVMSGRELLEDGLLIAIAEAPGAALVSYRKATK